MTTTTGTTNSAFTISPEVTAISFDIWKTLLNGNKAFTGPRTERVVAIGDERHESVARSHRRGGAEPLRTGEDAAHETDFSRLPSGSWLIKGAMSFVQA